VTFPNAGPGLGPYARIASYPRTEVEAVKERAVACANRVLQGTVAPSQGARELWLLSVEVEELADALRPFVGLASEWQDDPANREAYDKGIRDEAERLRRRFGP
jgi:hypothetical protein